MIVIVCKKPFNEYTKKSLIKKYEVADVTVVLKQCTHLSKTKESKLEDLLTKFKELLNDMLRHWRDKEYDNELKHETEPNYALSYSIPKAYEQILKMEVKRLCTVRVSKT